MEESKDGKHPFALYGSGEKEADIAGRKTHNVGPAASTNEVFFLTVSFCTWQSLFVLIEGVNSN